MNFFHEVSVYAFTGKTDEISENFISCKKKKKDNFDVDSKVVRIISVYLRLAINENFLYI